MLTEREEDGSESTWGGILRERLKETEGGCRDGGVHATREHVSRLNRARQRNKCCWNVQRGQHPNSISSQMISSLPQNRVQVHTGTGVLAEASVPLFQQAAAPACVCVCACTRAPAGAMITWSNRARDAVVLPTRPAATPPPPQHGSSPEAVPKPDRSPLCGKFLRD